MSSTDELCWSNLKQPVSPGEYFIPFGKDVCEKCKCVAGKAVGCIFEKCLQKPICKTYKAAVGTCCQFECIKDDDLPEKTEFIVLLSLGTGLLLLLLILFLLLCYRRGRNRAEKQKSKVKALEQISREQNDILELPNSGESRVEFPPSYTTATKQPPNEPPPPYIVGEESAV